MAISFKHAFTSAKTDGPDSTQVQPSNWNAEHVMTMATARLLGRTTASTGAVEEISVGATLLLSAGVLSLATNPAVGGNMTVGGTLGVTGTSSFTGAAQFTGAVGIGGAAPANVALDVVSTTKGIRFPRMTTTQRDAIATPTAGIVIYNTTNLQIEYHNGTAWFPVSAALDADLTAIAALGSTGIAVRSATNTWAQRTVTSSNASLTVTNPGGVAGNIDLSANGLGIGQSWQNVTGSRVTNTSYQNTTGKPIFVTLRASSLAVSRFLQVSTDNATWIDAAANGNADQFQMSAVVPNNHYYRYTGDFGYWAELR